MRQINDQAINALLGYLGQKPYIEVAQFIALLSTLPEAATAPVALADKGPNINQPENADATKDKPEQVTNKKADAGKTKAAA